MSTIGTKNYTGGMEYVSGASQSGFALLFAPNSLSLQAGDPINDGNGVHNLAGSHDLILTDEENGSGRDILNGAEIVLGDSPTFPGTNILKLDDPSLPVNMITKYTASSAAAGVAVDAVTFETDPSLEGGTTPLLSTAISENCMLFICCHMGATETAVADDVGFDYGGFRTTTSNANDITDGGAAITVGNDSYGSGVIDSIDLAWNGTYDSLTDLSYAVPAVNEGTFVKCISINGVTAGWSARKYRTSGLYVEQIMNNLGTPGLGYTGSGSAGKLTAINLGENCSSDFGIYFMGIKNYTGVIPKHEVAKVTNFMWNTGQLPTWWG